MADRSVTEVTEPAASVTDRRDAAAATDGHGSEPPPAIGALLEALANWRHARDRDAAVTGLPGDAEWPELPALTGLHALAGTLRNRGHVRRALAPAPGDAGPLNSGALVLRMFRLMHAQSPDYLRHFTAYVDTLAALQVLQQAPATDTAAGHGSAGTRPARKKAKPRPARKAMRPPAGKPQAD